MSRPFWFLLALFLARPRVAAWLIARGRRTPYTHIRGADGSVYMERFWLFNPYPAPGTYDKKGVWNWLPSIRLHHIMRPDQDRHLHNHPWNSRTIILRGHYCELRDNVVRGRIAGDTAVIRHSDYHRIVLVSVDAPWTLFITWRKRGSWGFLLDDGSHMGWREYLGVK